MSRAMAGRKDELWDANCDRNSIHANVECEENDGYDDELDFDDEIPFDLSSLVPTDECWYHGTLDRKRSEERLMKQGKPGSYLVRKSERKHGQYSLSYIGLNGISHFRITALFGDYYIGGRQYESLRDLIGYYTKYSCLLKDEKLEHPVQPPEPLSLSIRMVAIYSYSKPHGSEALSFLAGDVFVIEDNVNESWFWGQLQRTSERGMIPKAYLNDAPDNLSPYAGKPWFYDNLSKEEANELLMNEGVVGSFLIRPSQGRVGDYSLSVRDDDGVSIFLIKKQGLQYLFGFGGRLFDDLESIIERYKKEFIEQGLSLGNPIARREQAPPTSPTSLGGLRDLNVNKDTPTTPIYEATIESTVGPWIVKSGFLVKKGTSKKWKSMFFILNGEDEQFLFFDHQARTKPKGMIDLTYSMVYEVHESLFGRPNCFQIAVGFRDTQMFYLCADTCDEANDWIQALRKFCSKTRWTAAQIRASSDVKQIRDLELNIIEAHNLPPGKSYHPYCVVSLNEVRMSRTPVKEGENPVWNEAFKFNDIPEDIISFTVAICNRNKRSKDHDIACLTVALQILTKGKVVDNWYQLRATAHSRTEAGTIRIKARYMMRYDCTSAVMAEPFSHIESGTIDASTKLDKEKNVKDIIRSPSSQIDPRQTKDISLIKNPKQEPKTDYSHNPSKVDLCNKPLVSLSDKSVLISSKGSCKKLDLSGCGLTKLPEDLGDYQRLEELNLSNNPLSNLNISDSLEYFPLYWLKKLDLSGCGLTKLPEGLGDYERLEELNLSNNPLSNLDIFFLKYLPCYELKKLDLSGCGLTKLSEGLGDYDSLEELNLSNNPLSNLDISSLEYLPPYMLKKLDLSGCGLTKLPEGLGDYHRLEELNLSNNHLSNLDISSLKYLPPYWLKKLDLSGCGLTKLPDLKECSNLQELNFSNNSFDHQDLLEKLNSGKVFSSSGFHQSGKELLEPTASGFGLSKRTCRIIFEDAVYIQSSGVWTVAHKDVASTFYASSTEEIYKGQMWLEELKRFSGLSLPNKEIWLDEFCRIRKSKNLTIESYYAMLQSLHIVCNLVSIDVYNYWEQESTLSLSRCCDEIRYKCTIIKRCYSPSPYVRKCISYVRSAVSWLEMWSLQADDDIKMKQSITTSEMVFKEASEAFSNESYEEDKVLAAKLLIISAILSNLTKPEAAVLRCLQSLQELHELDTIRKVFSVLDREETKTTSFECMKSVQIAESVVVINKILFEFLGMFFKPPPTVKEWPATIQLDEKIYNLLIDGPLFGLAVSGSVSLDVGEDDNKGKNPITDATEYSVSVIKSNGETADNSITVDQIGGCFSLPEVSAFLLFPPNAVEETVTLKCSRVKRKECEVKPRDGEVFVSRILKIEPEGVTFKKPVTVILSHSLDEDQVFLYFYELIVENLSPNGCQELKTERISSIEDIPKEISNKEILENCLPFAKATIRETCTLVAATRATFNQILIPTNTRYAFSKQYGENAELKITFPAGVTKKILILNVQLFPADAVLNKDIRLNKSLVYAPIIRVSGQTTPFLKAVDVELTYSHSDVVNIEENFLPVEKATHFTTEYGLLMHNHNKTGSKDNWQALNESHDVFIERLRKDQLKFSFSVKHFSDVQPMVKTSTAVSFVPQMTASMMNMNNPACHHAIVLAVHKCSSSPRALHAVLAPKHAENRLSTKWNVKGWRFMRRLKCDEPVYFCVPMSKSDHLLLEDYTLWFDPEDESELANNTDDSVDLEGKDIRFLKDRECNNGENHTTQDDCRAKVPIHISETRSVHVDRRTTNFDLPLPTVNTPSAEIREPVVDVESPQERDVSSGTEDAQMNNNQISQIMMRRCELFEKTVETAGQKKLEINKECAEDPKGGKATKIVDVAGPTTTVIASLACGITAAMSIPTFGAASFAAAFVAGATFLVKIVDKRYQQANAKVVEEVLETATEQISSYLNCIVKDVAKELSRIFESQLFELQSDKQVKILAECAVDLMLDLQKGDTFNRNTLLKKVLQDGNIKKKKILTRTKDIEWSAPNVFRKPGLRRMIFGKDDAEFKHFIKPNEADKTCKYGYRGQFLEAKRCVSQNGEGETAATDETPTNEHTREKLCKDCSSNYEICSSGQYFGESEIDSHYTEPQNKLYSYNPLHILIQCPKVLESFNQLLKEKPSLANFLKSKLRLPEDHLVRPVYRPHSPRKVSDLQKSDLTGSDFSHSDFTNSSLQDCHFIKCVMLFVKLGGAKMSGSKFCDTLISHSNLEKLKADHCEWSKTSLLYSNVKGAHLDFVQPSIGDNCLYGTNICDAITGNDRELNCNEELAQAKISASKFCCDTLVRDNNSVEIEVDHCEGTNTSLLHSDVSDGQCLDPGEPSTSGNFSNETSISNTIPGNMGKLNYTTV